MGYTIDGLSRLTRDLREAPQDDVDWVTGWEAMWAVLVTLSAVVIVLLATTSLPVLLVVYSALHLLLIALVVQLRWRCIERHRHPLMSTLSD